MSDLCERRPSTGCSGFTPPGYETYVCHKACRVGLDGTPLYPELRDAFYRATAPHAARLAAQRPTPAPTEES